MVKSPRGLLLSGVSDVEIAGLVYKNGDGNGSRGRTGLLALLEEEIPDGQAGWHSF